MYSIHHLYADDTQLYIVFDEKDSGIAKLKMELCIEELRIWMTQNQLKLNDSKTEYVVVGNKSTVSKLKDVNTIQVGDDLIRSSSSARNIGAILDSELSNTQHVNSILKVCYMHLRS